MSVRNVLVLVLSGVVVLVLADRMLRATGFDPESGNLDPLSLLAGGPPHSATCLPFVLSSIYIRHPGT